MVLLVGLTLVYGTVRIGPTTPVCRAGVPCTKPAAHVVLTFTHGASRVRVTTDGVGRYHLRLRAGTWRVQIRVGMSIFPAVFLVPRTARAHRTFAIDTGIR